MRKVTIFTRLFGHFGMNLTVYTLYGGWFLYFNLKWIRRVRDFKNWLAAASGRRATWRRPTSLRIDRRDRAPSRQVTQFLPALSTLLAGRGKVHGNVAASRP